MSAVRKCDWCGKLIEGNAPWHVIVNTGTYTYPTPTDGQKDFCCVTCFKQWAAEQGNV